MEEGGLAHSVIQVEVPLGLVSLYVMLPLTPTSQIILPVLFTRDFNIKIQHCDLCYNDPKQLEHSYLPSLSACSACQRLSLTADDL